MVWGEKDAHHSSAAQRLKAEFGESVPPETIEATLAESFSSWEEARITMYVPVLAERAARDRLLRISGRKRSA